MNSGASGVYTDMNTIVCKQNKIKHGFGLKVKTANKSCMQQVARMEAPFSKLSAKEKQ